MYAVQLHRWQRRKVTGIPYVAHLMAVAALVLEDGGSEEETISALLHDAVEDQGGVAMLNEIHGRFGAVVATLVLGCTQPVCEAGLSWQEQKRLYLEQVRTAGAGVQRIVLADKVHNGRSLLGLLGEYGPEVWEHFSGGREGTLWLYGEYLGLFGAVRSGWMVDELRQVVLGLG